MLPQSDDGIMAKWNRLLANPNAREYILAMMRFTQAFHKLFTSKTYALYTEN